MTDSQLATQMHSDREVFGESPIKSLNGEISEMKQMRKETNSMIKNYDNVKFNSLGRIPKESLVAEKDALTEGIKMRERALNRLNSDGVRREYRKVEQRQKAGREFMKRNPNWGKFH